MIINVAHTKGGVGKTTIAVNLAITLNTNLLDIDTQHSSCEFASLGPARNIQFWKDPEKIGDIAKEYLDDPDKHIIIDSGGYDNNISRQFLLHSNIIVTPLTTSQVEFMGLQNFDNDIVHNLLKQRPGIRACALLNKISYHDRSDAENLREVIETNLTDYRVLKTMLGDRKIYKQAFAAGLSVVEFNRSSPAAKEINDLAAELLSICKEITEEKRHG